MENSMLQRREAEKESASSVGNSAMQLAKMVGNQAVVQRMWSPYGKAFLTGDEYNHAMNEVIGDETPEWLRSRRPAYATGQVKKVWKNFKISNNGDGTETARCVGGTDEKVTWTISDSRAGVWDMGHIKGHEYRTYKKKLDDGTITWDDFVTKYQDENIYQVEDPTHNRSHIDEA